MRQIKGRRRQLLYRKEIAMEVYLGVAVSLLIFRETAGLPTLLAGGLLIAVALLPVRKS